MGSSIATWRADPQVVKIMLNPDGRLWGDRLGLGLFDSGVLASPFVRSEMSGQD
jgi:type IV secretion system protein TrbB